MIINVITLGEGRASGLAWTHGMLFRNIKYDKSSIADYNFSAPEIKSLGAGNHGIGEALKRLGYHLPQAHSVMEIFAPVGVPHSNTPKEGRFTPRGVIEIIFKGYGAWQVITIQGEKQIGLSPFIEFGGKMALLAPPDPKRPEEGRNLLEFACSPIIGRQEDAQENFENETDIILLAVPVIGSALQDYKGKLGAPDRSREPEIIRIVPIGVDTATTPEELRNTLINLIVSKPGKLLH
jgi:hypothetical protein